MPKSDGIIKLLPSYVGAKTFWISYLSRFKGCSFVELFAGSAVLSINLAKHAVLNDLDCYIAKILAQFDKQIVPEVFTKEDYFKVRAQADWYRYAYCLQKMSFSGVFRYSKNGFNVPIKPLNFISVRSEYTKALDTYKLLNPNVLNRQYYLCNDFINKDSIVVIDPPYEAGQASYNVGIDYEFYWQYIRLNENAAKALIVFDYDVNLPFKALETRNMRVNGALKGAKEGIFIFENALKEGEKGAELFHHLFSDKLKRLAGRAVDFELSDGRTVELQSDYYNSDKTANFFFTRFANLANKTNGGGSNCL